MCVVEVPANDFCSGRGGVEGRGSMNTDYSALLRGQAGREVQIGDCQAEAIRDLDGDEEGMVLCLEVGLWW